MTVGSPTRHLLQFALPLLIGNLFQQFYNMVDSLVVEDDGGLTALIYPDWHQGDLDGYKRADFKKRIMEYLPAINQELPNYAQIKKIELMPEDFERTPKKSIKRYLYQRK